MLSGLAISATITALLAGLVGAFSPCGFSMVDTIGSALGDTRRSVTALACLTFSMGAVSGGILTFGGLGLIGRLFAGQEASVRGVLGGALALCAAVADWRGVRIAPQIRRQVPEGWRRSMPLPLACGLYGVLLGLGFTTFVLSFAVWALAGITFTAGSLAVGVLVGVGFGVGRALPIIWMAPGLRRGAGAARLDGMASEPRLWLGLRRLDAFGLALCALFLGGTNATAATPQTATDPSTAGGSLAWQRVNGPGVLRLPSGQKSVLPGTYPAVGGELIAWLSGGEVTVAERASMTAKLTVPAPGLDGMALSDLWLVYRAEQANGGEALIGVSLLAPATPRYVARSAHRGEIGRPSLTGSRVVFTIDTPRRSVIELVNLSTGARRTLRSTRSGAALMNPSLFKGRFAYERVGRCAQQLRIGSINSSANDRVIFSRRSTVLRDKGYEPAFEHAYNTASVCHNRASGAGSSTRLGPTALGASAIYVTETRTKPQRSKIVTIRRPRGR